MRNLIIYIIGSLLLTGCWECENCDDGYSCAGIGETEFTFNDAELDAIVYDQDFDPNSVPRTAFALDFNTYFTQTVIEVGDENNVYYCSDFSVPDTLIAINIYVKTADTTYNVNDALRTDNTYRRLIEDIDLMGLHFWEQSSIELTVVNWEPIPDTSTFVSELTFSSGFQHTDETEQLIFK